MLDSPPLSRLFIKARKLFLCSSLKRFYGPRWTRIYLKGKTCIGNIISGEKDGSKVTKYLFMYVIMKPVFGWAVRQWVTPPEYPPWLGSAMLKGTWQGRECSIWNSSIRTPSWICLTSTVFPGKSANWMPRWVSDASHTKRRTGCLCPVWSKAGAHPAMWWWGKIRSNLQILRDIEIVQVRGSYLHWRPFWCGPSQNWLKNIWMAVVHPVCGKVGWHGEKFCTAEERKVLSTFSPAFRKEEIEEICTLSDQLIFNSPKSFGVDYARKVGVSIGLRINPELSGAWSKIWSVCGEFQFGYPMSKLGTRTFRFSGPPLHTLCEQNFEPLLKTWQRIEQQLGGILHQFEDQSGRGTSLYKRWLWPRWIGWNDFPNFPEIWSGSLSGAWWSSCIGCGDSGGEVLDIMDAEKRYALLDLSATRHAPDVIEAPAPHC